MQRHLHPISTCTVTPASLQDKNLCFPSAADRSSSLVRSPRTDGGIQQREAAQDMHYIQPGQAMRLP
jgi:hypothetical protein